MQHFALAIIGIGGQPLVLQARQFPVLVGDAAKQCEVDRCAKQYGSSDQLLWERNPCWYRVCARWDKGIYLQTMLAVRLNCDRPFERTALPLQRFPGVGSPTALQLVDGKLRCGCGFRQFDWSERAQHRYHPTNSKSTLIRRSPRRVHLVRPVLVARDQYQLKTRFPCIPVSPLDFVKDLGGQYCRLQAIHLGLIYAGWQVCMWSQFRATAYLQ